MKYLCTNRLGVLGPSHFHTQACVTLLVSIVVCITLLPTIHCEAHKGRD